MRQRKSKLVVLIPLLLFGLVACQTPHHTNTMFFGTATKLGVDIAQNPTAGNVPTLTIGYKRIEAVWMPLMANADEKGKPASCSGSDCLFQGSSENDTYSVLASFGAKIGAGADAGGVKSNVGIAQYFATGLAAQKLADKGGAQLVAVQPPSSEAEIMAAAQAMVRQFQSSKEKILQFVNVGGNVDPNKLQDLLKGTSLQGNPRLLGTAGQPVADLEKLLDTRYRLNLEELAANVP